MKIPQNLAEILNTIEITNQEHHRDTPSRPKRQIYWSKCPFCAIFFSPIDGLEVFHCTEGWECNLGFGRLESFFANNGLGGFLGPKWKVFHHGTPRKHFQGVGIACGSRPSSEKGQKRAKNQSNFFALKRCNSYSKLVANWRAGKFQFIHAPKLSRSSF